MKWIMGLIFVCAAFVCLVELKAGGWILINAMFPVFFIGMAVGKYLDAK